MLKIFFIWLESLAWKPALLFMFALFFTGCIIVLLVDRAIKEFSDWRERRAIRARNHTLRMQRAQLIIDANVEREAREAAEDAAREAVAKKRLEIKVWRDRVQARRESNQFHVPAAFRDFKGTQR